MGSAHCLFLAATIAATGCAGHRQGVSSATNTVTIPGVISCWADWIKDKGDKFDISFNLRNDSPETAAVVFLRDIGGGRGDAEGKVRHSAWVGERSIDLRPGESKRFTLTCGYQREVLTGDFRISIHKVFDNPSGDGRTPGRVVAENVVWTSH